jgi:hypothetical protein
VIKCCICDVEKLQITSNHVKKHGLTLSEYKVNYPNSPLQDESIILRGERNPFYGKRHTEKLKKWQSEHFKGKKCPTASKKISDKWKDPNGAYRKMMKSENYRKTMSEAVKIIWQKMSIIDKQKRIAKQINTMMLNGTFCSKGELRLYEILKKLYPTVKHGYWLHKSTTGSKHMWNIDFYIPEIETFVQFDGVYWHGLNKPIDQIRESNTPRNQAIYGKWLIDREQDVWFSNVKKRLIRITDIEFKNNVEICLLKIKGDCVTQS